MEVEDLGNEDQARDVMVWELGAERTWEALRETADGRIDVGSLAAHADAAKAYAVPRDDRYVLRGMQRYLLVVMDMSHAMLLSHDMRPSRAAALISAMEELATQYLDQNPLSQLALVTVRDGLAQQLVDFTSDLGLIKESLKSLPSPSGEMSLQNALETARSMLGYLPPHCSKEVLVVLGGLVTADAGNVEETIGKVRKDGLRCSVLSLSGEVFICKYLAETTGGVHHVPMNKDHFLLQLNSFVPPPPLPRSYRAALIPMGFPTHHFSTTPTLCQCHQEFQSLGYICPRCNSKYCNIPTDCDICGLVLVAPAHLARSYHHLMPVPAFSQTVPSETIPRCKGCVVSMSSSYWVCPLCKHPFCDDCNRFVHDSLHSCPGCEL